jgi:hypothetical protein
LGDWRDASVGFAFAMLKSTDGLQIACRYRELKQQQDI